MDTDVRDSLETVANLIYLARLTQERNEPATQPYLDHAEARIKMLSARLEKRPSQDS